jgi:hypothetical protein
VFDAVVVGNDVEPTALTRAIAAAERPARARAIAAAPASSRPVPPVAITQPFCAPFSRNMRVSFRVSMSQMPRTPASRK